MRFDAGTLTRLRAFEAVGRLGSFTRAAAELFVTPAALSQHVRRLEHELGAHLLVRLHRRIELTEDGARLLVECTDALRRLEGAVTAVRQGRQASPLTISVAPYFSARWLRPRLANFWSSHPEIDLRLHHAYQPPDFQHDNADAGISWGSGRWPNTHSELILDGSLTPVCDPSSLRRLSCPADLLRERLLYEFDVEHWRRWFAGAGVPVAEPLDAKRIDDSHTLGGLAADGHGVALFFVGLVREDLADGRLVRPFDIEVDPGDAYYLTMPRGRPVGPKLAEFSRWLRKEATTRPYA